MEIRRHCQVADLNWAALPDLETRLVQRGVTVNRVRAEITKFPETVSYSLLGDAARAGQSAKPTSFKITIGGQRGGLDFTIRILSGWNLHDERYLVVEAEPLASGEELDDLTQFLGLQPAESDKKLERSVFVAHRFDEMGEECAERLARFLELLNYRVATGRGFAPKTVSGKVRERLAAQALVFVVLTPGDDNTWLAQESVLAELSTKPLFVLKEASCAFKPGVLADLEFIPFEGRRIEATFIPILEGLRELGYMRTE